MGIRSSLRAGAPGRRRRLAAVAAVLALVVVGATTLVVAASTDDGGDRPAAGPAETPSGETLTAPESSTPGAVEPVRPPVVRLPEPARGKRALELLGDELPEAARANGLEPQQLRELVLEDPSVWLDRGGRVYFVDDLQDGTAQDGAGEEEAGEDEAGEVDSAEDGSAVPPVLAELSAVDAFSLHSNPGASRTVFLDFDGVEVSGTYWNSQSGVASGTHAGWDPAGDGPGFSSEEMARVRSVWARVAEDFAPFEVDVTTQDPGQAAIERSGSADQVYGTRVAVSASRQASDAICGSGCGGVAYLRAFASSTQHAALQPAWVFPAALGNDTKSVAEAASHEAGHNLGLRHDGHSGGAYYTGHGIWAPIMGSGYQRPVVQWSRGSYPGANNQEDDLQVMLAGGAPLRRDEAGATLDMAASGPPEGAAVIGTPDDQDVYALGTCAGDVMVAGSPAGLSPNLDLALELLDSTGSVLLTADPRTTGLNRDVAQAMGATLVATVPSGPLAVRVSGVGNGDLATGYDDYGSVGSYSLQVTGCGAAATEQPSPSPSVAPTPTTSSPTPSPTPTPSPSATTTTSSPTASPSPTAAPKRPSSPKIRRAAGGRAGAPVTAQLAWLPPASADPGVTAYHVRGALLDDRGRVVRSHSWTLDVPSNRTSATLSLPRAGRWRFGVAAENDVGLGAWSAWSKTVAGR